MRRIVELLILVLCLGVLPAAAQSILPDSLAGWSAGPTSTFLPAQASSAENAAHGAKPPFQQSTAVRRAAHIPMRADSLQIAVYQMKDPSGLTASTFLRSDMAHADFTDHSSMSDQHALTYG
jgi:hypothetical protein